MSAKKIFVVSLALFAMCSVVLAKEPEREEQPKKEVPQQELQTAEGRYYTYGHGHGGK